MGEMIILYFCRSGIEEDQELTLVKLLLEFYNTLKSYWIVHLVVKKDS